MAEAAETCNVAGEQPNNVPNAASVSAGSEQPAPQSVHISDESEQSPAMQQSAPQSPGVCVNDESTEQLADQSRYTPGGNHKSSTIPKHSTAQSLDAADGGDESTTTGGGDSDGDDEYIPSPMTTSAFKRRGRQGKKRLAAPESANTPSAKRQKRRGQTKVKAPKNAQANEGVEEPKKTARNTQQLQERLRQSQTQLEKQDRIIANQNQTIEDLSSALQKERAQVESMKWRLKESEANKERAEALSKSLSDQLQETQDEYEEIRQRLERVIDENLELRDIPQNKVADGEIRGKWEQMAFLLQQSCINTYMTEHPNEKTVVPFCKEREGIIELIRTYKDVPDYASDCPFQRYIWKYLRHHVFPLKGGIWAGDLGERFVSVIKDLTDEANGNVELLEALSKMKSKFATALDKSYGIDKIALEAMFQDCCTGLYIFVTTNEAQRGAFTSRLRQVFEMAVWLQITCLKSRAHFQRFRHREGDLAEWATPGHSYYRVSAFGPYPIIQSHIGSGLLKIGSADGWDFDKSMVLSPAILDLRRRNPDQEE